MDDAAKRLIYERNGAGTPRRGPRGSLGSSTDPEGQRIIAERNGRRAVFGKAAALSAEDAQLLAKMRTNRRGRAVLGIVAQYLRQAYEIASTIPTFISPIDGTKMVAAGARSLIDQTNRYAQKTYAGLPDDDAPISDVNQKRIGEALREARSNLAIVSTEANDLDRGLTGALLDLLERNFLPSWLQQHAGAGTKKWLVIGGAVVVGLIVLSVTAKLVHTVAFGQTALGEAEEAAVAIAEAKRRKRHARSALSIS